MKKLSLIIFSLLLCFSSFGQLNYFFPDSNSYFSVSWMKFWFEGDTTINDFKYKKVYMQSNDSIADFSRAHYFTAIREDTIAEKVYCFNPCYGILGEYDPLNEERELLLYDFSVNVGDTVRFCTFIGTQDFYYPEINELIVKSIDYVLIDNNYRKRINLIRSRWETYKEFW